MIEAWKVVWFSFFVLLTPSGILSRHEWIDPHDMNNRNSLSVQSTTQSFPECPISAKCDCDCSNEPNVAATYYKRMISLLLSLAVVDHLDMLNYKGHLHINIPPEEFKILKRFTQGDAQDSETLRTIDKTLTQILTKSSFEYLTDRLISWTDHIYFTFYNRTTGILTACLLLALLSYKLLRANLTIWTITKYLIFLGWVTDFAFTWINFLQEAEINNMADSLKYSSIPPHCDPNSMTAWQYIKYMFNPIDNCREYHRVKYHDHFWSVGPVMVLSHQLGTLIVTPATNLGIAVGSFTKGILNSLPWGINIILLPLLLLFAVILICIFLSFITETSLNFNILHLLSFEFGKNERRAVGDFISGQNLSTLLGIMHHRNMIEEVRQADAMQNTVTSAESNFSEPVNHKQICSCSKSEPEQDCDVTIKSISDSKSSSTQTHDGSGDAIENVIK